MVVQMWDASALTKRYSPETGSDTVDALFAAAPSSQKVSTAITYAEIHSVLLRKFNRSAIDRATFEAAKSTLRSEPINDPDFVLLSVDDDAFYNGSALMERHNLNSTDAAFLVLFLPHAQSFTPGGGLASL